MRSLLLSILFIFVFFSTSLGRAGETKLTQYTHVIPKATSYYLQGPQQAMPPQGTFKPGTKVILLQNMGSYTRVKSEDGIEAAVSTESLQKIQ